MIQRLVIKMNLVYQAGLLLPVQVNQQDVS